MTTKPKLFWQAWCDICEDIFPATRNASRTRYTLERELKEAGWLFRHRTVCPDCIEEERRPRDLTNREFGRLVAVKRVQQRPTKKYPKSPAVWRCMCVCHRVIEVRAKYLLNGNTKSCGCLQRDTARRMLLKRHKENQNQGRSAVNKNVAGT